MSKQPPPPPLVPSAKLLQSCPTLCDPLDGSPPGSDTPGILQARTLEWVAISFSNAWKWKVKVKSLSCVWLFTTPGTAAYQAPPSMGFFQARVLEWGAIASSSWKLGINKFRPLPRKWSLKTSKNKMLFIFFCSPFFWPLEKPYGPDTDKKSLSGGPLQPIYL